MALFSLGSMTHCSSLSVSSEFFRSASSLSQLSQPPQTLGTPLATFRENRRLFGEKPLTARRLKLVSISSLTSEAEGERLSLSKVINGVEEVLIFLFATFRYEFLCWSDVVRFSIVRLFLLEKIRFQKTHDKKKEDGKPKISGEFDQSKITPFRGSKKFLGSQENHVKITGK